MLCIDAPTIDRLVVVAEAILPLREAGFALQELVAKVAWRFLGAAGLLGCVAVYEFPPIHILHI